MDLYHSIFSGQLQKPCLTSAWGTRFANLTLTINKRETYNGNQDLSLNTDNSGPNVARLWCAVLLLDIHSIYHITDSSSHILTSGCNQSPRSLYLTGHIIQHTLPKNINSRPIRFAAAIGVGSRKPNNAKDNERFFQLGVTGDRWSDKLGDTCHSRVEISQKQ